VRKAIVFAVLSVLVVGPAVAGELTFHVGVGYHMSFYDSPPDFQLSEGSNPKETAELLQVLPLGVGAYAGLGYGFGFKALLSLGLELAPSWSFSVFPAFVSNLGYQARVFLKVKPIDAITATVFTGWAGDQFSGGDIEGWQDTDIGNGAIGARLTIFPVYIEYAAIVPWDFSTLMKNEVGIGFALYR